MQFIRSLLYLPVVAVSVLMAGCVGQMMAYVRESGQTVAVVDAKPTQQGLVFVAVGTQVPAEFDEASLSIRPVGEHDQTPAEEENTRPHFHRAQMQYDESSLTNMMSLRSAYAVENYAQKTNKGSVIVAALPPGNYEIYRFDFKWNGFVARTPTYFSVPFHVGAGQAVYLGRFTAQVDDPKKIKTWLGADLTASHAHFAWGDDFHEDGTLLLKNKRVPRSFSLVDAASSICTDHRIIDCGVH